MKWLSRVAAFVGALWAASLFYVMTWLVTTQPGTGRPEWAAIEFVIEYVFGSLTFVLGTFFAVVGLCFLLFGVKKVLE